MDSNQSKKPILNVQTVGALASRICRNQNSDLRFRFAMDAQSATNLIAACYKAAVEYRQRVCDFDEDTKSHIIQLAEIITQPVPRFGIMCTGNMGNGKTTLMYAFQRAVNYLTNIGHFKSFLYERFDTRMRIMTANEIAEAAHDSDKFQDIKSRWMLGIDDLGTEPTERLDYGNSLFPLIRLLEYRYANQLFTFVTTNLDGDMLLEHYEERIYDRIMEMFEIITYGQGSYRD